MTDARFKASLRISGESLNPPAITRSLGLEPSVAHAKGEARTGKSKSGKVLHHPPWTSGIWILESDLDEGLPLETHLIRLLDQLEPKSVELQQLRDAGMQFDFFCGQFMNSGNKGYVISPGTLERMARLGADFGVSTHSHGQRPSEPAP